MFDGAALSRDVHPLFVATADWPRFADRVRPHLDRMARSSGGRYEEDDIAIRLGCGLMHLWLVLDGAEIVCVMVTELVQYPRLRALRIVGLVGYRPRRWMHLLGLVEHSAKVNFGCAKMECLHSIGHERLLRTGGWRLFHALAEKDLS